MNNIFINPEIAFAEIEKNWKLWAEPFKNKTMVIGVSGGIDSTCVVALACKIFGSENTIGVSLPCDGQKDMDDVNAVFDHFKIRRFTLDIGDAFVSLKNGIENNTLELTDQCITNMPARLRMTALFGVAQCLDGIVINTCNRSESVCGYDTFGGDNIGSYAPIKNLTKTEVRMLAEWLGTPYNLTYKVPIDGLQPYTDEEKFGFSYNELDAFIRVTNAVEIGLTRKEIAEKIKSMYIRNKFKLDIVNIPGPKFDFLTDTIRQQQSF
jgi:NAD+ synthase